MDFEIRGKGKADNSPSVQFKHKFCLFIFCKWYENNSHVYFVIWKKACDKEWWNEKETVYLIGHICHCMCRNLSQANYDSKWTFLIFVDFFGMCDHESWIHLTYIYSFGLKPERSWECFIRQSTWKTVSTNAFPRLLCSSFQLKCKVGRTCLTSSSWFREAVIAQTV